jgi:hypothetical protein
MLAELLERVALQQISAKNAICEMEKWAQYPWEEKELADAFHALVHFDSDADIQEENQEYATTATNGLLERARKLRS